jgi:hypothetical protein
MLGMHLLLGTLDDEYGIKKINETYVKLGRFNFLFFNKLIKPFKHKHYFILFLHKGTHNGYGKM